MSSVNFAHENFYVDTVQQCRYTDESAHFTRRCASKRLGSQDVSHLTHRRCDRKQRVWVQGLEVAGPYCPCRDPERYKYICLGCRRVFKPAQFGENAYVRECVLPNLEHDDHPLNKPRSEQEQARPDELMRLAWKYEESLIFPGPSLFSRQDLEALKQESHRFCLERAQPLRCCKCGEPGRRVVGAFSAPPQKDIKAWKKLEMKLANGGQFDCCETWRREVFGAL